MKKVKLSSKRRKKLLLVIIILFSFSSTLITQCVPTNIARQPISEQLYKFSPLAEIIVRNLGMEDKNGNGVIDKNAREGYEEFVKKYGNADNGYFINGIIQGADNNRLEENEIVNHYYVNIRFKPAFTTETNAIDNKIITYIYANSIPLVWLDDSQETVMNKINNILGTGWNEWEVTESEAIRMFEQTMDFLYIRSLDGDPNITGHYEMPEIIRINAGYCFEMAQFKFWFFSQLKISSSVVATALTPSLGHGVLRLNNSNTIIDYFGSSNQYRVSINQWAILNPIQSIGEYYIRQARSRQNTTAAEQAVIYNKYNISDMAYLMNSYDESSSQNHSEIIALGEFILANTDISRIMTSKAQDIIRIQNSLERILGLLIKSYSATRNHQGFSTAERLLNQYFSHDPNVRAFIDQYRF